MTKKIKIERNLREAFSQPLVVVMLSLCLLILNNAKLMFLWLMIMYLNLYGLSRIKEERK